jgi:hypothetical protein
MMTDALRALARHAGVVPSYTDQTKRRRRDGLARCGRFCGDGPAGGDEAEAAETLAALRAEEARRVPPWSVVEAGVRRGARAGRVRPGP